MAKLVTAIAGFVVVCVLAIPAGATGTYNGGEGTAEHPYEIDNAMQLISLSQHSEDWGLCFELTDNIDMDPNVTGIPPFTTALIAPDIGSEDYFQGTPFTGFFDGNDFVISNLMINTQAFGNDHLGLFGVIDSPIAHVSNLGLENVIIFGGDNSWFLGGLCGLVDNGTINNCYSNGSIRGDNYHVGFLGGVCGQNNSGNITNCHSNISIAGNECLGGICGVNYGTVNNCYAAGSIVGMDNSHRIGGLCGSNYGNIENSYAIDFVNTGTESSYIGGLCGLNLHSNIIGCYSGGLVISGNNSWAIGGLSGTNHGSISICYSTSIITGGDACQALGGLCALNAESINDCFASGTVYGGNNSSYLGGVCGINDGKINNCFANGSVVSKEVSLSLGGFCGWNNSGNIINCYSIGAVIAENNSGDLGGLCGTNSVNGSIGYSYFLDSAGPNNGAGTPLTDSQMKEQSSFAGWAFTEVWHMPYEGAGYPMLWWQRDIAGDVAGRYGVDLEDAAVVAEWWGQSGCGACGGADIDGSGAVDIVDLAELAGNWLEGL